MTDSRGDWAAEIVAASADYLAETEPLRKQLDLDPETHDEWPVAESETPEENLDDTCAIVALVDVLVAADLEVETLNDDDDDVEELREKWDEVVQSVWRRGWLNVGAIIESTVDDDKR